MSKNVYIYGQNMSKNVELVEEKHMLINVLFGVFGCSLSRGGIYGQVLKIGGMIMYWGYHRCSTEEQNLDRGIAELNKYFNEKLPGKKYKIFTDKHTGKDFDRPQYKLLKEVAEAGDELIITEVDRLGRDKYETLKELRYFKDLGVNVRVLEIPTTLISFDGMENNLASMMMETINNLLIELYSTLAQAEMEKRAKRQREGIEQMKVRGEWKHYGRPSVVSELEFKEAYGRVKSGNISVDECLKILGIKRSTYYVTKKRYNL